MRTGDLAQLGLAGKHYFHYSIDSISILQKVGSLEPKYQQIVDMVYFHGYKLREISRHLDIPIGTVKSRLRKGIFVLRSSLD